MMYNVQADLRKWHESVKESNDFESWMNQLPDALKSVPITHLAIPGTHDSMSCGISRNSAISPDASDFVKTAAKYLGPLVKPFVFRWSVTQHPSAAEQLAAGIRYFDLRIALHKPKATLQFVHGMFAQEITQPLCEIKQFLLDHQGEVVILDLQHFYELSSENHCQLQNLLEDQFGSLICPLPMNGDLSVLTLSWLSHHKYQVIIIYRCDFVHENLRFWPSRCWPTPWPQTTSIKNMIKFLKCGLAQRPPNAGFVTQCVLTPDTWFVVHNPFSNLRSKCAAPCNRAIVPWLEGQRPGQNGINVVIADFFDFDTIRCPIVKTVVLLNSKLVLKHDNSYDGEGEGDCESIYLDVPMFLPTEA